MTVFCRMAFIILVLTPHLAYAQNEYIILKGTITPDRKLVDWSNPKLGEAHVRVRFNGSDHSEGCRRENARDGSLCQVYVGTNVVSSGRLEIRAPGFKRLSRVFVVHRKSKGSASYDPVDLGVLRLVPSELPQIEQVIHADLPNKIHQFEVILRNSLERQIFIKKVGLSARLPSVNKNPCCCPPNAIFKLSSNIKLVGGGTLRRTAEGTFQDGLQGVENQIRMEGSMEINGCYGDGDLQLDMPSSILIPSGAYSSIKILIPEKLTIEDSFYGFRGKKSQEFAGKPSSLRFEGYLSKLGHIGFEFVSGEEDELTFGTTYKF